MTTTDDVRAATDALMSDAAGLSDEQLRAPCSLPGWSRGHLLTHLARSADAMGNLVTSARTGVPMPAYASPEARAAGIEAGAGRPAGEILADLTSAADRLLAGIDSMSPAALERLIRLGSRDFAASRIAFLRLREVQVHHVDLDVGFAAEDWSGSFVISMLDDLAPVLRGNGTAVSALAADDLDRTWTIAAEGPVLSGTGADVLAWVLGRRHTDALAASPGPVPPGPTWL